MSRDNRGRKPLYKNEEMATYSIRVRKADRDVIREFQPKQKSALAMRLRRSLESFLRGVKE